MSARRAVAAHRPDILNQIIASPFRSRAKELVESGLLDRAARISELAHSLTDSALAAMEAEWGVDFRPLRGAVFEGIAYNITDRLDGRG